MVSNSDRKGYARIDVSASGDSTIISAPTNGHIEIDHLEMIPTGGANTITVTLGVQVFAYALDDNQAYVYDRTTDNTLQCDEATLFKINLSAATQVSGFVLYRIVGESGI